ncbi:MAG: DMT family transporter [Sphingopyxis sp.]|uniref:DMT family transporter n=1 Tax=Sphingopyxis sp. TaxID=1908224 RepID=UPI002AB92D36|nr:DMT family transporter [Sphingopyxis sp.]MDZ3832131.1 DMT family transporter [Sphingopyxis sp.]
MSQSLGIGFAMVAALTTASSHAMLKSGEDQEAVRALCGLVWVAAALPFLFIVGLPSAAMLPWLAGAIMLHSVYSLVLTRSYTLNDFAVAFPIARGTAPLVTVIGGAMILNERPSPTALIGIAAISLGIIWLSTGGRIRTAGLLAALGAGCLTAAYTIVDAGGMRASEGVLPFLSWFFFGTGLSLALQYRASAGPAALNRMRRDLRHGVKAGALAIISFGSTLVALRYAPVAIVSALRETCILISLFIAWGWMGERMTARSITAALLIIVGTLILLLWNPV